MVFESLSQYNEKLLTNQSSLLYPILNGNLFDIGEVCWVRRTQPPHIQIVISNWWYCNIRGKALKIFSLSLAHEAPQISFSHFFSFCWKSRFSWFEGVFRGKIFHPCKHKMCVCVQFFFASACWIIFDRIFASFFSFFFGYSGEGKFMRIFSAPSAGDCLAMKAKVSATKFVYFTNVSILWLIFFQYEFQSVYSFLCFTRASSIVFCCRGFFL